MSSDIRTIATECTSDKLHLKFLSSHGWHNYGGGLKTEDGEIKTEDGEIVREMQRAVKVNLCLKLSLILVNSRVM